MPFTTQEFFSAYRETDGDAGKTERYAVNAELVEQTDSTNSELLRRLNECKNVLSMHKTLFASASQSAGRGRIGRTYFSPDKTGIYFSLVWAPEDGVKNPYELTVASSVAVSRAIEKVFGAEKKAQIKWVNDVLIDKKKVCGILTEGFMAPGSKKIDAAVIGIGVNLVMAENAPVEILNRAGGILSQKKYEAWKAEHSLDSRTVLLSQCVFELVKILEDKENIIPEYRARSALTGLNVTVIPLVGEQRGQYTALVKGISDSAGLIVQLEDGTEKEISTGEVSIAF